MRGLQWGGKSPVREVNGGAARRQGAVTVRVGRVAVLLSRTAAAPVRDAGADAAAAAARRREQGRQVPPPATAAPRWLDAAPVIDGAFSQPGVAVAGRRRVPPPQLPHS